MTPRWLALLLPFLLALVCEGSCGAGYYQECAQVCFWDCCSCKPCAAGQGSPAGSDNANQCTWCQPGEHSPYAGSSCQKCPVGRSSSITGATSCSFCPSGRYSSAVGSQLCLPCSVGRFQSQVGQSSCSSCSAGYESSEGASACTPCSGGYFSSSPGAECRLCPGGKFSRYTSGSSDCVFCPRGYINPSVGGMDCFPCPSGTYQEKEGQVKCEPCGAGFYSIQTSGGAFSQSVCQPCASGTYGTETGLSGSCTPCPVGKYGPGTLYIDGAYRSECRDVDTENRQYAPQPGTSSPLLCGFGSYIESAMTCTPCGDGWGGTALGGGKLKACERCGPGRYSSSSSTKYCLPCSPGSFSYGEENAACDLCSAGFFQDQFGQQACKACNPGSFAPSKGSLTCTNCSAGSWQHLSGLPLCFPAPKGTYINAAGASSFSFITLCPAGTFNEVEGQTIIGCRPCPAGTASNTPGAGSSTTCVACANGTFAGEASPRCLDCPAGSYCTASNTISPPETVTFEGIVFPVGQSKKGAVGPTEPTPCKLGYYSSTVNATSIGTCKQCPNQGTTSATGSTSEAQCLTKKLECLPGQQLSPTGCTPLACAPHLLPASGALSTSNTCRGCPPGRFGTPNTPAPPLALAQAPPGCAPCPPASICPGLTNRALVDFSVTTVAAAAASPPRALSAAAADPRPSLPCPATFTLLQPPPLAAPASSTALPSSYVALVAAASLAATILLGAFVAARVTRAEGALFTLLRSIDVYKMEHEAEEGGPKIRRSTVPGGLFTLIALTSYIGYLAFTVEDWRTNNASTTTTLAFLDDAAAKTFAGLPYASWGGYRGLVLRLTIDGEPGLEGGGATTCRPPAPVSLTAGLDKGAWELVDRFSATCPASSGSAAAQVTYTCAACALTQASSLTFILSPGCQSILIELLGVTGAGAASFLSAALPPPPAAAPAAAAAGGTYYSAHTWTVEPLKSLFTDSSKTDLSVSRSFSSIKSTSLQGFVLSSPKLGPSVPVAPLDASSGLADFTPAAAPSLTLTINLPLSNTFSQTLVTQINTLGTMVGGLISITTAFLGAFAFMFGVFERPPWAKAEEKKAAAGAKAEPEAWGGGGGSSSSSSSGAAEGGAGGGRGQGAASSGTGASAAPSTRQRPQSAAKVVPFAAADADPAAAAPTPATSAAQQQDADALPPGWQAAADASGATYYYNAGTCESSWERPAQPAPAAAAQQAQAEAGGGAWAGRGAGAAEQLPLGWQRRGPTAEGHFYYEGPQGQTQWEPPPAANAGRQQQLQLAAQPAAAAAAAAAAQQAQVVLGSGAWAGRGARAVEQLPLGWQRRGPTAEGHYWFEGPQGQTQWEPPAAGAAVQRPRLVLRG